MDNAFEHLPYRPCVGILLLNANGLIFTGERLDTPGAWQMPQGGIERGEPPQAAALRELQEETGLDPQHIALQAQTTPLFYDLPPHLMGKLWQGRYRGQEQIWFKALLKAPDSAVNIKTAHPEFRRWRWSNQEQLLSDIVPFKRPVYQAIVDQLLS